MVGRERREDRSWNSCLRKIRALCDEKGGGDLEGEDKGKFMGGDVAGVMVMRREREARHDRCVHAKRWS